MIRSMFLAAAGAMPVALALPQVTPSTSIGLVGPFSGPARQLGMQLQDGAQGAIDEINAYSTISSLGRTYTIRTFDDQNTIANAQLQAQFAAGDGTIIAAIGHVNADATLHAIPTYATAQLPLVVPVCTDDRITDTNYIDVFRLQTKDSTEGALFARDVAKAHQPKKPFILVQDADYGADVANGFINGMNEAKIVTPYLQFGYDRPDFGAVADKVIAATPDFVFLAGTAQDMGPIVPALRAKGYTGAMGASQGFFDAATLKLGAAANDLQISTSMPYLPFAPASTRYRNDYEVRRGPLTPVAAFSYAAVQLIVAAVQRSNAQARNVLLSAMQSGITVETVVGNFAFSGRGDQLDPQIYFYTVRDGKFTYAHQAHPSTFMIK